MNLFTVSISKYYLTFISLQTFPFQDDHFGLHISSSTPEEPNMRISSPETGEFVKPYHHLTPNLHHIYHPTFQQPKSQVQDASKHSLFYQERPRTKLAGQCIQFRCFEPGFLHLGLKLKQKLLLSSVDARLTCNKSSHTSPKVADAAHLLSSLAILLQFECA